MKEIRETKMVEQTTVTFVAKDGKQFTEAEYGKTAGQECAAYERRLEVEKVEEKFKRLKCRKIDVPFAQFWYGEYAELWEVELKDKEDLYTLSDYLIVAEHCYKGDVYFDEPESYPYTMLVGKGCEWAYEYLDAVKDLEQILTQLNNFD